MTLHTATLIVTISYFAALLVHLYCYRNNITYFYFFKICTWAVPDKWTWGHFFGGTLMTVLASWIMPLPIAILTSSLLGIIYEFYFDGLGHKFILFHHDPRGADLLFDSLAVIFGSYLYIGIHLILGGTI